MVDNIWLTSALWIGLALAASLISMRLALSIALVEIMMGALGGNIIGMPLTPWINYLASFGAILLTFLAGAEVDPDVVKRNVASTIDHRRRRFRRCPISAVMLTARYLFGWPLAAIADHRHRALHHLSRGGLRGHGGNRPQQDRDRQDHPRRLLRQRPRDRARARRGVRVLHYLARRIRRGDDRRSPSRCRSVGAVVLQARSGGG